MKLFFILLATLTLIPAVVFAADTCDIKKEQSNTFFYEEEVKLPILLFVDPMWSKNGYRNSKDVALKAIKEWNEFGKKKLGSPIFEIAKMDQGVPDVNVLNYTTKYTETRAWVWFQPAKSDISTIKLDVLGGGATGYTEIVRTAGHKNIKYAIVQIWTGQPNDEDIQRTVLHELGHAIGLEHSCDDEVKYDPNSTLGRVGCVGLNWTHDYHKAIMFPMHQTSQVNLQKNDLARAYCSISGTRP